MNSVKSTAPTLKENVDINIYIVFHRHALLLGLI